MKRHLVLPCLVLLLSVFCLLPAWAQDAATTPRTAKIIEDAPVKLLDSEGAGKLYQAGEHLVCVLEGTPEEMGFQHGRLLAQHIVHGMKTGYTTKALWNRGYTPEYVHAQSARMAKFFPPDYVAEMKGILAGVEAAGVKDFTLDDVYIGVTQAEILHFKPDAPPPLSCSNFAVWGKWTADGRLLHGRNLDWDIRGDAQDDAVTIIWRPKGGTPFLMVGWSGAIGSVSGMNAKGITIGEMTLPSPNATFDGQPLFILMRRVLQEAATLDEAVAILRDTPRTSGWNFIVGDAKIPDGRAFETDAKRCNVYAPLDPKENEETLHYSLEDAVRRTNHPVAKDTLLELAIAFGDKFGFDVENWEQLKAMMPLLRAQDSYQRYDYLGKEIQKAEKRIDAPEAIEILINGPVYCDVTLHSWVFDPSNKCIYLSNAGNNPPVTACDRPYTKIDVSAWMQ